MRVSIGVEGQTIDLPDQAELADHNMVVGSEIEFKGAHYRVVAVESEYTEAMTNLMEHLSTTVTLELVDENSRRKRK